MSIYSTLDTGVVTPATLTSLFEYVAETYSPDEVKREMEDPAIARILTLAVFWREAGAVVYELSHSTAALFALTSAPDIAWSSLPHGTFGIKVPGGFGAAEDSWIFVASVRDQFWVVWDTDYGLPPLLIRHSGDIPQKAMEAPFVSEDGHHDERSERLATFAYRFVGNLLAYINEHRDRVEQKPAGAAAASRVFVVRPPHDVIISREFRDAARAATRATNIVGIRRALAHVVRGHWRNQPVGEGRKERKLTWVRPHKRGDESLGRVVQRIERLRAPL